LEAIEEQYHTVSAKWLRNGERCTKEFFNVFKDVQKKASIPQLNIQGKMVMEQKDKVLEVMDFYKQLYSEEPESQQTQRARPKALQSVPKDVINVHNKALVGKVSMTELREAIMDLTTGHVASEDGIRTDFYKNCSDENEAELLLAVQEVMDRGSLSKSHNKRIITLLLKGGNSTLIRNYKPIILLNTFYKLVAKILASRLQQILPEIIRPNQTGFVSGRSIIDNIFLAQESMSYAEESGQDLVLFLLDFEKAYD